MKLRPYQFQALKVAMKHLLANMIFGADLMPDNIQRCIERLHRFREKLRSSLRNPTRSVFGLITENWYLIWFALMDWNIIISSILRERSATECFLGESALDSSLEFVII